MKAVILYQPHSEHARRVEEYIHDFNRSRAHTIESISLETREGVAMASLYDVVHYPAILALQDDGQLLKDWQGEHLPLMNEVAAYAG